MFRKIVSYEVECDLCHKIWNQESEPDTNVLVEDDVHLICLDCVQKLKRMFEPSPIAKKTLSDAYKDVTEEYKEEPVVEEKPATKPKTYKKEGPLYVDNPVWDSAKLDCLCKMYKEGKPYEIIASELKVTEYATKAMVSKIRDAKPGWPLYQFVAKLGPKRKPGRIKGQDVTYVHGLTKQQLEAICINWGKKNMSKQEVAEMLHLEPNVVNDALNAVFAAQRGNVAYDKYRYFLEVMKEVTT